MANEFYFVVASKLNLQYGNVLLTISTKEQMQEVLDNNWPFFVNETDNLRTCLEDDECEGLQKSLKVLGKICNTSADFKAYSL